MKYIRNGGTVWMVSLRSHSESEQEHTAACMRRFSEEVSTMNSDQARPSCYLMRSDKLTARCNTASGYTAGTPTGTLMFCSWFSSDPGWLYIASANIPNFLVFLAHQEASFIPFLKALTFEHCNWLDVLPLGTRMTLSVVFHSVTEDSHSLLC